MPGLFRSSKALVLSAAISTASAQSPVVELEPLEISATRAELALADVAGAVTVIEGEALRQRLTPANLAEALDAVPGLFVQNAGNFSQDVRIALRGFGAQAAFGIRGVAIVVDGIPQTLPDGQAQVDSIDLAEVERIEILRGPSSALYGNAAGGVILITTRGAAQSAEARLGQDFGEYGRRDTRLAVAGPIGPVGARLSLQRFEQDGFRAWQRVEQYRAGLKLDWRPAPATRMDAVVGYFDAPEELDPGGLTAAQARTTPRAAAGNNQRFDAGESLEQWRIGLGVHQRVGSQEFRLTGFGFWRDFDNRLPFAGGGSVALERRFYGTDIAHRMTLAPAGLRLRLDSGVELRRQHDQRARFDNLEGVRGDKVVDQREQVDAIGLYIQAVAALHAHWNLTVAARHDAVRLDVNDRRLLDGDQSGRRTWRETSPGVGLNWRPGDALNLFFNFGTAFQTPTTTELANPDDPGAGGGFNRALGPETARNLELGGRWRRPGTGSFEASVFRTRVDDAIASIEVPGFSGTGREFFSNAGRSTRYGIEVAGQAELGSRFGVDAAYSYSDFEFDQFKTADGDFSGNRLPGVPRHRYSVALRYADPKGFTGRLRLAHVGTFYADNANRNENDARTELVLDLGKSWQFARWQLRLKGGVINLLDQRYNDNVRINAFGGRFFEPAPDRHFYAGLEVVL